MGLGLCLAHLRICKEKPEMLWQLLVSQAVQETPSPFLSFAVSSLFPILLLCSCSVDEEEEISQ